MLCMLKMLLRLSGVGGDPSREGRHHPSFRGNACVTVPAMRATGGAEVLGGRVRAWEGSSVLSGSAGASQSDAGMGSLV